MIQLKSDRQLMSRTLLEQHSRSSIINNQSAIIAMPLIMPCHAICTSVLCQSSNAKLMSKEPVAFYQLKMFVRHQTSKL